MAEGEKVSEAAELTLAEEAIVDIFKLSHLNSWFISVPDRPPQDKDNYEITAGEKTLVSAFLKQNSIFRAENSPLFCLHNPLAQSYETSIGTVFYLQAAIALNKHSKRLFSPGNFSCSVGGGIKPAEKLWKRFERLGLADKNYGDYGFTFIDLSDFDLEKLNQLAKSNADKIKAQGHIDEAIAKIQARLRKPAAGEILDKAQQDR